MAQTTFALMTNLGRSKEAAALANNTAIEITEIAIGNGTTVPSGGETKLYNEVARKKIVEHGLVAGSINVAYFDIFLSATDGPYQISEAGLYDSVGDLIAIAHYNPAINKPTPESGQTVEGTIRIEVAFSNVENIIVQVDSTMQVPFQRLTTKPFVPVISINTLTPPATPNIGDCYIIPINATGAWTNQANQLAEYTNAGWSILTTPNGHGIGLSDGSFYIKIDGVYVLLRDEFQKTYDTRYIPQTSLSDIMQVPLQRLTSVPFVPVLSMTLTTPPASVTLGDCYIVPSGANGAWANKENQLAEYNGTIWQFKNAPNGHGIGLPDGSFYIKIDGVYVLYQVFLQNVFDSRYTQPNSNVFLKKSDFSSKSLFQVNGYQILPNGLMLQWGSVSGQASSTANNVDWFFIKKVIFPLAFPTACMSFVLGSATDVDGSSPISEFTELNDTSVAVILNCQDKNAIVSCFYFAIGY